MPRSYRRDRDKETRFSVGASVDGRAEADDDVLGRRGGGWQQRYGREGRIGVFFSLSS